MSSFFGQKHTVQTSLSESFNYHSVSGLQVQTFFWWKTTALLRLGGCSNEAEFAVCTIIFNHQKNGLCNYHLSSISRFMIFQSTGLYQSKLNFRYTVGLFHNILHITSTRKKLILLYTNNKCADQLVCPHSLTSAFLIRYLEIYTCSSQICVMQNFNILGRLCSGAGWLESDFSNRLSRDDAV